MKLICEKTIAGVTAVRSFTTPSTGDQGSYVKTIAGVGNPFFMWPSIPPGTLIGADFTDAPICNTSASVNNAAIAAMAYPGGSAPINPSDVLVFA